MFKLAESGTSVRTELLAFLREQLALMRIVHRAPQDDQEGRLIQNLREQHSSNAVPVPSVLPILRIGVPKYRNGERD